VRLTASQCRSSSYMANALDCIPCQRIFVKNWMFFSGYSVSFSIDVVGQHTHILSFSFLPLSFKLMRTSQGSGRSPMLLLACPRPEGVCELAADLALPHQADTRVIHARKLCRHRHVPTTTPLQALLRTNIKIKLTLQILLQPESKYERSGDS
jgi:hypothetical protein